MKRHLDFVIDKNNFDETIFRIYPKKTYIHSFNDEKPTNWKQVYKVYYSWAIIRRYYYGEEKCHTEDTVDLIRFTCDECSCICGELSSVIKWIIENEVSEDYRLMSFGLPASDWTIKVEKYNNYSDKDIVSFKVFDSLYDTGCRFRLQKDEALEFANWLDNTNEYLLEVCGCPI